MRVLSLEKGQLLSRSGGRGPSLRPGTHFGKNSNSPFNFIFLVNFNVEPSLKRKQALTTRPHYLFYLLLSLFDLNIALDLFLMTLGSINLLLQKELRC